MLAAIALDRITTGRAWRAAPRPARRRSGDQPRRELLVGVGVVAVGMRRRRLPAPTSSPSVADRRQRARSTTRSTGSTSNLRTGVPIVGGTGSFSDFLVLHVLDPVRDLLVDSPWWVVVAPSWRSAGPAAAGGWRHCAAAACVGIAALRNWDLAMDTLSQVLVIVAISVALAVPIGILAGPLRPVSRILRPLLDAPR